MVWQPPDAGREKNLVARDVVGCALKPGPGSNKYTSIYKSAVNPWLLCITPSNGKKFNSVAKMYTDTERQSQLTKWLCS